MSIFRDAMKEASRVIGDTLGDSCTYEDGDGGVFPSCNIIINRNEKVTDDYGILVGYRCSAIILNSDIQKPVQGDKFTAFDNTVWKVLSIIKETPDKWHVDIVEV